MQRGLKPSFWANRFRNFRVRGFSVHCRADQQCHADNLIEMFRSMHPRAFDRLDDSRVPTSAELNVLARARKERFDSDDSEVEQAVLAAPTGWRGEGKPMTIGSGYL